MPRPIGERITQVCETLQELGPSTVLQVAKVCTDIHKDNVRKYLSRATGFGLMTHTDSHPMTYKVIPEWRDKLKKVKTRRASPIVIKGRPMTAVAIDRQPDLMRVWR